MTKLNADGNLLGRLGAITLLAAAGFGLYRLNCSGGMCPPVQTDSCCAGAEKAAAAPVPAK
ncbi:MAG: hypothetical protein NDJ72_10430 [Elusimicrobia bacterium]|nr:hypothetical protein [Elusimicrobiota bacterium]